MGSASKIVRVPGTTARIVRRRLNALLDEVDDLVDDDQERLVALLSNVAAVCAALMDGAHQELVARIERRVHELRRSDARDDLVAAGELEDLLQDLGAREPDGEDDPCT